MGGIPDQVVLESEAKHPSCERAKVRGSAMPYQTKGGEATGGAFVLRGMASFAMRSSYVCESLLGCVRKDSCMQGLFATSKERKTTVETQRQSHINQHKIMLVADQP